MVTTEQLIGRLKWWVAKVTAMLAVVLCCSACDSVFDDEGDCDPHYFVRFVYDMNMLRADAFASQVSSVDLYVFDAETGAYVAHLSDQGEALASGNYRMPLNLTPGKYDFVAWCGLADNDDDFTVPQTVAQLGDLKCTMARSRDEKGAYSNRNLHALFHGSLTAELPDAEGEHVYTVRLIKDTNNINLSLNHTSGPLDPEDFEITLTDENGLMAHDNSLLTDEQIEYRPWSLRSGDLEVMTSRAETASDDENGYDSQGSFLKAEISTARLMANRDARINVIDKEHGKVVFSIPLIKWALLLRSENHASMGEQEYLDREDEYDLMVFLADDKEGWMAMEIVINGWHIINDDGIEF